MRRGLVSMLVALGLLAVPAASYAGTATTADGNLRYTALGGEANDVHFARVATDTYRITDLGAPVLAGTGCTQDSPNVATCKLARRKVIIANLGDQNDSGTGVNGRAVQLFGEDGDDRLQGGDARDTLDGGHGNDQLSGGAGNDRLNGGSGDDRLGGDAGRDVLQGGDGNDLLVGGSDSDSESGGNGNDVLQQETATNGADVLAGNGGNDTVDYSGRTAPVDVSLNDVADDGDRHSNERDNVRSSIEKVIGGSANDVLIGRDGGADVLVGGPGDDVINPRRGNDVVDAGPGTDQILVRDLSSDQVSCGDGTDAVSADGRDSVGSDCENVHSVATMSIAPLGRAAFPTATVRIACPVTAFKSCTGRVVLRTVGKVRAHGRRTALVLGQRRFSLAANSVMDLTIKVRAGVRPYIGSGGLLTRAQLSAYDGAGPARKAAVRFRLHAR